MPLENAKKAEEKERFEEISYDQLVDRIVNGQTLFQDILVKPQEDIPIKTYHKFIGYLVMRQPQLEFQRSVMKGIYLANLPLNLRLNDVFLGEANFQESDIKLTALDVYFGDANFKRSNLNRAFFIDTYLVGARFDDADLTEAAITHSSFFKSEVQDTSYPIFTGANVRGVTIEGKPYQEFDAFDKALFEDAIDE
jgi:uncharacterized protein YjbI with pentapeptide repeats